MVVRPHDDLSRAVQFLSQGQFDQLPVVDQAGALVGLLTHAHVLHWLQLREAVLAWITRAERELAAPDGSRASFQPRGGCPGCSQPKAGA